MIYADENVWQPVVEGLRRRGWEVTSVLDEGTLGDSDAEHLERAAANDWILLTFDDDFLSLSESGELDIEHAGIIYASQHGTDVGGLVRSIDAVLERNADRDLHGEILYA